jgi:hypothetical protein
MIKLKELFKEKLVIIVLSFLIILTITTNYYGSTDTGDYTDSTKYFSGKYQADIRSSHSYIYSFIHSPYLFFFDNFFIFKITSIFLLFLIIYSVYYISGYNKKVLWLILLSPSIWYMAPWISPIQISSLCLLWAWAFINRFDSQKNIKDLIFSGILVGLGISFWNTVLYFGVFLSFIFLIDKKFYNLLIYLFFILVGFIPNMILEYFLFNFPLYSLLKTTMGNFSMTLFGGIYNVGTSHLLKKIGILFIIMSLPLFYLKKINKNFICNNLRTFIFLCFSLILIIISPQIRYLLILMPIIILLISKENDEKVYSKQIFVFLSLSILMILPYLIQINYESTNYPEGFDIVILIEDYSNLNLTKKINDLNLENLFEEVENKCNETPILVGPDNDDYAFFAKRYWGDKINEFVSFEDYNLWLNNNTLIFEKKVTFTPIIKDRREIWFMGGMNKNSNDITDYEKIICAIGLNKPIDIKGDNKIIQYGKYYLSIKEII